MKDDTEWLFRLLDADMAVQAIQLRIGCPPRIWTGTPDDEFRTVRFVDLDAKVDVTELIDRVLDLAPAPSPWKERFHANGAAGFFHPTMPVAIFCEQRNGNVEIWVQRLNEFSLEGKGGQRTT